MSTRKYFPVKEITNASIKRVTSSVCSCTLQLVLSMMKWGMLNAILLFLWIASAIHLGGRDFFFCFCLFLFVFLFGKSLLRLRPIIFLLISFINLLKSKSLLRLNPWFFCYFLYKHKQIHKQIFTSAQPIIFLLISFIYLLKTKSLLQLNPWFFCYFLYKHKQIFTLAQTHHFSAHFLYVSIEIQIFTSAQPMIFLHFLDASTHLYKRVCPSIGR